MMELLVAFLAAMGVYWWLRMSAIASNGVFPWGSLERIPGGQLAKGEVVQSRKAMYKAARGGGITLSPAGEDSSARSVDRQVYWRQFWCAKGHCEKAAVPGTSNHGWAKAVDVHNPAPGTAEMKWLQLHGPGFERAPAAKRTGARLEAEATVPARRWPLPLWTEAVA